MTALTLNLGPLMTLTREGFVLLCAANPELKLERPAQRELGVVSPTSGEMGNLNLICLEPRVRPGQSLGFFSAFGQRPLS